ncbi:MAG: FmdB family zinc ribbon protein [bacterium]
MPLFEYYCPKCQARFEILCKASEKPVSPPCPTCNNTETKGILTGFAVRGTEKPSGTTGCSSCHGGNCSTCH